jgi:hypothetical protein
VKVQSRSGSVAHLVAKFVLEKDRIDAWSIKALRTVPNLRQGDGPGQCKDKTPE